MEGSLPETFYRVIWGPGPGPYVIRELSTFVNDKNGGNLN